MALEYSLCVKLYTKCLESQVVADMFYCLVVKYRISIVVIVGVRFQFIGFGLGLMFVTLIKYNFQF